MAISDTLNRRVRARPEEDDESVYSGESDVGDQVPAADEEDESDAEDQHSHSVRDHVKRLRTEIKANQVEHSRKDLMMVQVKNAQGRITAITEKNPQMPTMMMTTTISKLP